MLYEDRNATHHLLSVRLSGCCKREETMAGEAAMEAPVLFDLLHAGEKGQVEIVLHRGPIKPGRLPINTIPVGVPPVLPTPRESLEKLLLHPEDLPIHRVERAQRIWPREADIESLYEVDTCPIQTTLVVDRDPTTGELLGFREEIMPDIGSSAKNSTSLRRPPGPPEFSTRGCSTNLPFWPGGLEEPNLERLKPASEVEEIDFENDLQTIPPGMQKGGTFPKKHLDSLFRLHTDKPATVLKLTDLLTGADGIRLGEDEEQPELLEQPTSPENQAEGDLTAATQHIDDLTKTDSRNVTEVITLATEHKDRADGYEWAVKVDISKPVADFHKRIHDMAYSWPFELDIFQKQAILHLESHDNVFVAAHTSAGKTVVAEYAIALCMKHMTRSIYTSPIKALSNQKFRDFKQTFEDVGLITGDIQLRPEAACLIMTTEILRSMLYNGSDVIRDLEWVIFDEVHYINDSERGVVWEEVLIMLPQHVHIILLSATVPNTMEFADWVGRTKRRKVYVVSTQKRPVPLEHYLYTGNSSKTSNQLFKVLDANKKFLTEAYYKAIEAKKERASKSSQSYGPKGTRSHSHPAQDKNVWLSVIEMLRKKDKLPVVAFTFSKKRINETASALHSVDLTTSSEKSEIHVFFQKCVNRLKGTDRQLPQVLEMSDHLKRGVGIHHSGVLPILKEVVEMLFQRGLVKILFATETFAMGVNMPARTVVFDTIRKFGGQQMRSLLAGEYIQMAGRAGRRGLDTTGTVIILAKGDVPEMSELHSVMLGNPTQLQSQFRLTYAMILNLLRVEQLRVEDMMRRSFSEFHNQRDMAKREALLKALDQKITEQPEVVDYAGDLEAYYHTCQKYRKLKAYLQKVTLSHPAAVKALTAGRVVVIDMERYRDTLGVILQANPASSKERIFTALVMCEQDSITSSDSVTAHGNDKVSEWDILQPVTNTKLFQPEGPSGHAVVKLKPDQIAVVTVKTLKINADKIMDDVHKRTIPRFRSDPPGQSTSLATQELLRLVEANPDGLPGLDPIKDLHLRDLELVEEFQTLSIIRENLATFRCVNDPNFMDSYHQMAAMMKIKEEYNYVKFLLSEESLQLLPEYQQRIQVLKKLKYIDNTGTVQLKGRVACEISNHELIITELILENMLTELHPTEICALLSCVVFQQQHCSKPELLPRLKQAMETFQEVARRIGLLQKECQLHIPVEDYVDQFHFGLMEVVFEWARGMPFSELTQLTDVQEGVIVKCIQRLDEVLRDVRDAARMIGDPGLYQKMEQASSLIKRDIVFAASLYTQ